MLQGRSWWVIGPNDHIYYFTPRTMARLFEKHGLAVHDMHTLETPLQSWLRVPALQRFAPLLGKLTAPVTNRFLLGDDLYVVARRLQGREELAA